MIVFCYAVYREKKALWKGSEGPLKMEHILPFEDKTAFCGTCTPLVWHKGKPHGRRARPTMEISVGRGTALQRHELNVTVYLSSCCAALELFNGGHSSLNN